MLKKAEMGKIVGETTGKERRNTTPRKRPSSEIKSIHCA